MKIQNKRVGITIKTKQDKGLDCLKQYGRGRCKKCGKVQSYTRPLGRCFECGEKFCYEHLNSGQVNNEMDENEEIRNVCDKCKEKHGYYSL
jgi:hypothetical protein